MTILILFDSLYGNTQAIAAVIGETLSPSSEVKVLGIGDAQLSDIKNLDLLIVGSPTQGGRPTEALLAFLNSITETALARVKVAAFDTRFVEKTQKLPLRLLMKTIGYAAPKILTLLQKKGGTIVLPAEGFFVEGKEGPLAAGEAERARVWALLCAKQVELTPS